MSQQEKILVSACLAGVNCRYDGKNNDNIKIKKLIESGKDIIFVCPEQLGGLSTPRVPAELIEDKILDKTGKDVTSNFQKGAEETLKIAKMFNIKFAILKAKSPSCGSKQIYDGTFSDTLTKGEGVTTTLLKKNGIEIINEYELVLKD